MSATEIIKHNSTPGLPVTAAVKGKKTGSHGKGVKKRHKKKNRPVKSVYGRLGVVQAINGKHLKGAGHHVKEVKKRVLKGARALTMAHFKKTKDSNPEVQMQTYEHVCRDPGKIKYLPPPTADDQRIDSLIPIALETNRVLSKIPTVRKILDTWIVNQEDLGVCQYLVALQCPAATIFPDFNTGLTHGSGIMIFQTDDLNAKIDIRSLFINRSFDAVITLPHIPQFSMLEAYAG